MPILHRRPQGVGFIIESEIGGEVVTYRLSPEGEQFVTMLLSLKDGDEVRAKDLSLLVDRDWAVREEAESERVVEPLAEEPPPPEPVVAPPASEPPPRPGEPAARARGSIPKRSDARHASARRTRGREVALQILYQMEQNAGLSPEETGKFIRGRLRDETLQVFAEALVAGVRAHQEKIDELISSAAENWRIDRMAAIDRNILRIGAYEMLYDPGVPKKVAINESLELAKRYSTAQSSRFVNGILDRLQNADPSTAPPSTAAPAPSE